MAQKKALAGRKAPTPAARPVAPGTVRRPLSKTNPEPAKRRTAPVAATRPVKATRPAEVPRHTGDRRPTEAEVEAATATLQRARGGVTPRVKVRALRMGFYDHKRRRVGDVFALKETKHFSRKWMVRVDPETPDKITTGQEELRQKHDEILGARMEGRTPATQSMETLDDEPDPGGNPLDD